ncbi:unnamed protein product [Rotaria sp. Silwood2]|nr:unnamed protein product [Rotaria sp. Silwood2]CAF4693546.1 unnamed protein product [Rotaria sp. Silwood2]
MATSTIVNPTYSYFSFFKSIEDNDDNKYFFIIFKKLENSISLKSYLQLYLNKLTMDIVKYLIKSILISIIKLKNMFIIHLDLNSSNIFIMNNDNIHNIRLIDFSIIKFIYKSSSFNVMYSENLHESFQSIFFNCPSCFYSTYSIQTIIFAQPFHQSFQKYTIEQILNQPFLN